MAVDNGVSVFSQARHLKENSGKTPVTASERVHLTFPHLHSLTFKRGLFAKNTSNAGKISMEIVLGIDVYLLLPQDWVFLYRRQKVMAVFEFVLLLNGFD